MIASRAFVREVFDRLERLPRGSRVKTSPVFQLAAPRAVGVGIGVTSAEGSRVGIVGCGYVGLVMGRA
jgi:hypothetical protein